MTRKYEFPVLIEWDEESKLYVAFVPSLPGCHTCGATLDELQQNIQEVVELCLEEMLEQGETEFPTFVDVRTVTVKL